MSSTVLPIFSLARLVSTFFFHKTGHVFSGFFMNALLVTWILVAGPVTLFAYENQ